MTPDLTGSRAAPSASALLEASLDAARAPANRHTFTRTNFELGRIYLRMKRPRDAVAILQPALRGAIDASNLYVTRTELHELLAQAWDAAGNLDSAAVHYAWIAKAWSAADPALAPRLNAARTRLAALKH